MIRIEHAHSACGGDASQNDGKLLNWAEKLIDFPYYDKNCEEVLFIIGYF